jgi:DNA-binding response OmpR family regulator
MTMGASARRDAGARHVYLAEDDDELRKLLVGALRKGGFEVASAVDGPGVLALARAALDGGIAMPDAFVMDVRMPRADGLHILHALRLAGWTQPVVLMTGFGDPELHAEAAEAGAAAVLDKPFDVDELIAVVRLLTEVDERGPTTP